MALSADKNCQRDLWTELRKLDYNNKSKPISIDGSYDDDEIADFFWDKISVITSPEELQRISDMIDDDIRNDEEVMNDNTINVHDVQTAIDKLKRGKYDGMRGTCSNHYVSTLVTNVMFIYRFFCLLWSITTIHHVAISHYKHTEGFAR